MKKAVFLFNKTMIAPQPWIEAGYETWLFDSQHPVGIRREGNVVTVGMKFVAALLEAQIEAIAHLIDGGVEFLCSFAPCTYLACSGSKWFYHPDDKHLPVAERRPHPRYPTRRQDQRDGVQYARMVELLAARLRTNRWMLENPAISHLNTAWRKPDHVFHPFEYGGYLPPEGDVHPDYPNNYPPNDAYSKATGLWCGSEFVLPEKRPVEPLPGRFQGVTKGGGSSLANKNMRSATPRGFALALFAANGEAHV